MNNYRSNTDKHEEFKRRKMMVWVCFLRDHHGHMIEKKIGRGKKDFLYLEFESF